MCFTKQIIIFIKSPVLLNTNNMLYKIIGFTKQIYYIFNKIIGFTKQIYHFKSSVLVNKFIILYKVIGFTEQIDHVVVTSSVLLNKFIIFKSLSQNHLYIFLRFYTF